VDIKADVLIFLKTGWITGMLMGVALLMALLEKT
jgi:hypothetical protein